MRDGYIYAVCDNKSTATVQCAKTILSEVSSFFASAAFGSAIASAVTAITLSIIGFSPIGWVGAIALGLILVFSGDLTNGV